MWRYLLTSKYFKYGLILTLIGALDSTESAICVCTLPDYIDADPDEKRELLSELLWNFSIKDKIVQDFQFKPTYEVIAKEPKPTNFAMMCPGWDSNPHGLTATRF